MADGGGPIAVLCVGFLLCSCGGSGKGEQRMQGWLLIGHEVRSFLPCGRREELWLIGSSPALEELKAEYAAASPDGGAYMPLLVRISGRRMPAPSDGFGADYAGGLIVDRLLQVQPQGDCGR